MVLPFFLFSVFSNKNPFHLTMEKILHPEYINILGRNVPIDYNQYPH